MKPKLKRKKIVWDIIVDKLTYSASCGGRLLGRVERYGRKNEWRTDCTLPNMPYGYFKSEMSAKRALEKAFDKFLKDVTE